MSRRTTRDGSSGSSREPRQPKDPTGASDPFVRQLQHIYAMLCRDYYYRKTGRPSAYGLSGSERELFGGYDETRGTRVVSPMIALAEFVTARQLDPFVYLRLVFTRWEGSRPPTVSMLTSDSMLAIYKQAESRLPADLARQREIFDRTWKGRVILGVGVHGMSEDEAGIAALQDPSLELSCLYRYCVAASCEIQFLMDRYEKAALIEYAPLRSYYNDAWGALIPAALRQLAEDYIAKGVR